MFSQNDIRLQPSLQVICPNESQQTGVFDGTQTGMLRACAFVRMHEFLRCYAVKMFKHIDAVFVRRRR